MSSYEASGVVLNAFLNCTHILAHIVTKLMAMMPYRTFHIVGRQIIGWYYMFYGSGFIGRLLDGVVLL